jgi:hypothetical protein
MNEKSKIYQSKYASNSYFYGSLKNFRARDGTKLETNICCVALDLNKTLRICTYTSFCCYVQCFGYEYAWIRIDLTLLGLDPYWECGSRSEFFFRSNIIYQN